jgi:NADH:ubiquinone oxidoreductase subunit 3 (subunit A)
VIFWGMAGFLSLVTVGYVYAIRKGVLDWKKG